MSKSNRSTSTNRRSSRPIQVQRPFKPIPAITEQRRGKALMDTNINRNLVERIKEWGNKIKRFFGRSKKRRTETTSIKSRWRKQERSQYDIDKAIHKATIKAKNRRQRKATRALHQRLRRAS